MKRPPILEGPHKNKNQFHNKLLFEERGLNL